MLRSLHIRNYILIDSLDIDFPEGLQIITGSTGAGKSILLGALALLLGSKADATAISAGKDSCVVEAEFDTDDETIRQLLEEEDLDWDNGHLLIRRVVHSTGRSRSFVGDCPVQVSLLSTISEKLIDIHGQHQSLMLTDRAWQLNMLDSYCGNGELRSECKNWYQKWQTLISELNTLEDRLTSFSEEKDYKKSILDELERAHLSDENEMDNLDREQKELSNAEEIKESLSFIEEAFSPKESEGSGVVSTLKDIEKHLHHISAYINEAESLSERIESSRLELDDISSEISRLNSRLSASPERLASIEGRMSTIYTLFRKHSCRTIGELIEKRDSLRDEVLDSDSLEEKIASVKKEITKAYEAYESAATKLHSKRASLKDKFSAEIEDKLHYLELDKAVFVVSLEEDSPSASGTDKISFLFDASSRIPSDVAKCASGGELSRIMLCLKDLMARYKSMPTMIFDEIDTGVSGSVADKMGSMICSMGEHMQVFAITHLPQVAAKGSAHFLVSKTSEEGSVRSNIKKLSPEERVMEIARMLSGSSITSEAIANAKSLLAL